MTKDREVEFLRKNWKDEMEAALLYRQMAEEEQNDDRRQILQELALTEERHANVWSEELNKRGVKVERHNLTLRAKIYLWLMKRLSSSSMLQIFENVEKQAASGYSEASKATMDSTLKKQILDAALTERGHSRILATMDGGPGNGAQDVLQVERWHRGGSSIKEIIFGMNDGLLSTFSLVTGVAGATANNQMVLLSGIAGGVAGAISMTAGAYVATKAETEVLQKHLETEKLELSIMHDQEETELSLMYRLKGMSRDNAKDLAHALLKDQTTALEAMGIEELGVSSKELPNARKAGLASGLSFMIGAVVPVFPYLVLSSLGALVLSISLSLGCFFLMGVARALVTARSSWRSGLEMLFIGTAAAVITYMIGLLVGVELR